MTRLTPADVHNISFRKPPLGKRGYDEEEVDGFLDRVEQALTEMSEELEMLRNQRGGVAATQQWPPAVLTDLDLIKERLARIEAAVLNDRKWTATDPTAGGLP